VLPAPSLDGKLHDQNRTLRLPSKPLGPPEQPATSTRRNLTPLLRTFKVALALSATSFPNPPPHIPLEIAFLLPVPAYAEGSANDHLGSRFVSVVGFQRFPLGIDRPLLTMGTIAFQAFVTDGWIGHSQIVAA
jgi:hypothetical protein